MMTAAKVAASRPLIRELRTLLTSMVAPWAEECTRRGIDDDTIRFALSTVTIAMSRATLADDPAMFNRMARSVMDQ